MRTRIQLYSSVSQTPTELKKNKKNRSKASRNTTDRRDRVTSLDYQQGRQPLYIERERELKEKGMNRKKKAAQEARYVAKDTETATRI